MCGSRQIFGRRMTSDYAFQMMRRAALGEEHELRCEELLAETTANTVTFEELLIAVERGADLDAVRARLPSDIENEISTLLMAIKRTVGFTDVQMTPLAAGAVPAANQAVDLERLAAQLETVVAGMGEAAVLIRLRDAIESRTL